MKKRLIVNDRNLQLGLRGNPEIILMIDEIIYSKDALSLVKDIEQYEPLLAIINIKEYDEMLLTAIDVAKRYSLLPNIPFVLITDLEIPDYYKRIFNQRFYSNYAVHTLVKQCESLLGKLVRIADTTAVAEDELDSIRFKRDTEGESKYQILLSALKDEKKDKEAALKERVSKERNELKAAFETFNQNLLEGVANKQEIQAALDEYLAAQEDSAKVPEMRVNLNKLFWPLYKDIVTTLCTEGQISLSRRLFLRYGIMDTRLLSDEIIWFLCDQGYSNFHNDPIYYYDEWLPMIYVGDMEISVTDETRVRIPAKDYPQYKQHKGLVTEFETMKVMYKYVSGAEGVRFNILDKTFVRKPEQTFCTRAEVKKIISHIDEDIDPTIFRRRTLTGVSHVPPRVLIIPAYGRQSFCWQVWDKSSVDASSRIICPFVSHTTVEESVIMGLGSYRWEYSRDTNPLTYMEEGLIADYAMFNNDSPSNLSNRFFQDYYTWVTREAVSRTILSKELRQVFWTRVPFGRNVVEKIKKNSAYTELLARTGKHTCLI